jgi:hypothetical protein
MKLSSFLLKNWSRLRDALDLRLLVIESDSAPRTLRCLESPLTESSRMQRFFCAALIGAAFCATGPLAHEKIREGNITNITRCRNG